VNQDGLLGAGDLAVFSNRREISMSRSALLVSTAIGLTFAAAGPAVSWAKVPHQPGQFFKKAHDFQHAKGAPARPQRDSRAASSHLKESYVVVKSGSDVSLTGGFSVIDTTALNCKKACTIVTDTVATFASYYSYNHVSLCPAVDGYFTTGSCLDFTLTPTGQHVFPQLTNTAAGAGTHTVSFYAYTVAPAYITGFQIDYHVYK
jgi:hypothetical protein